jgi:hypothetical protein
MVNNSVAPPKRGPFPQASSQNDGSTKWRCVVAKHNRALSCAAGDNAPLSEAYAVLRAHEKNDHDGLSVETLVSTIALSPIIGPQATRFAAGEV